ncbi:response regulator [Sulfuritalea sp.]|uniref:response regulator n=1 Tax=Sulfuritalea sp. TaxID=2480090 RepID=UPI001AD29483|nr:response regulator [Sulfuritalea sp.]MBN8475455.1 response regulator [Sulfuritalea sp.]
MAGLTDLDGLFDDDGGGDAKPGTTPLRRPAAQLLPCPYGTLSYLLIEDSQTMRVWLRNTIANAGGTKIDVSDSYHDALYRIRNRGNYDVVLCDYILSDTRDGQQLLEEVRRQKLLPQSTIWIMITGERKYEQVFSAVELAPDDYLIKPISPDMLHVRLGKAWDRRQALKGATDLFDAGRFGEALEVCRRSSLDNPRHSSGFQRIAGECMLQMEHFQEAYDHFESILTDRPVLPWAKLGKARAFFHLDRYDETAAIIEELIHDNPDYLHAHDLLAKVHERKGDLEATKVLLKLVLEKNPKSLQRQREIARIAVATDDPLTAIDAYAMMHRHGRGSSFIRPGDFSTYAGMLIKSGSKAALERLEGLSANLADFHKSDPAYALSGKTVSYAAAVAKGDRKAVDDAYQKMRQALGATTAGGHELDREESMFVLEAAVEMGDEDTACQMAQALYQDHIGNQSIEARIMTMMAKGGWEAHATRIAEGASENLRQLNVAAANMAKHGQLLGAVEEFARLAESNKNVAVYLNAATCIVKCFEELAAGRLAIDGDTRKRLNNRMQGYLNFVALRDVGNHRLEQIRKTWEAMPH